MMKKWSISFLRVSSTEKWSKMSNCPLSAAVTTYYWELRWPCDRDLNSMSFWYSYSFIVLSSVSRKRFSLGTFLELLRSFIDRLPWFGSLSKSAVSPFLVSCNCYYICSKLFLRWALPLVRIALDYWRSLIWVWRSWRRSWSSRVLFLSYSSLVYPFISSLWLVSSSW